MEIIRLGDDNSSVRDTLKRMTEIANKVSEVAPELMGRSKEMTYDQSKAMNDAFTQSLRDKPSTPIDL